jgi:hypothetical protein
VSYFFIDVYLIGNTCRIQGLFKFGIILYCYRFILVSKYSKNCPLNLGQFLFI